MAKVESGVKTYINGLHEFRKEINNMTIYRIGSNQYQKKVKNPLFGKADKLFALGITIYALALGLKATQVYATNMAIDDWLASHTYLSAPVVTFNAEISPTLGLVSEKELKPTKPNIVAYIMEVFGKYGTDVGVQAINCFYSESGLRTEAYNYNTNGTDDRGIAQVNSIHGYDPKDLHDLRKNIDAAEQIYLRAGKSFRPWYGVSCN